MVFETIVADLLNRFLGDYVENLNSKQLNVGIWGGDVVLHNLEIRSTALDSMDLPLQLKSGALGTLTLKIPWKDLYGSPVIATIEDLYVLATPKLGIKYDAVKEEKQAQESKQRELNRVEEQRKAKRKKPDEAEAAKPDTFAEKMVMNVIKNLQVTIRNIHVRYEDEFTNPNRPFAMGATLHSLVFQTTDENWMAKIVTDSVTKFFKVIDMDSLSLYWNTGMKLISRIEDREEAKQALRSAIATSKGSPQDFTYMLWPISISARLRMNPKPETDGTHFTVPKIDLTVDVKELGFHIGKYQYQGILEFLDAQERLTLNARYRKYRPDLREYKGHEKQWWRFAVDCILKDQVQRKARNWSWKHMKAHRNLVRSYRDAWIEKCTNLSPPKDTPHTIEKAEKELDVFNLNIARQQAEMIIERKKLKRVEEQGGIVNWVSSWFGGGSNKKASDDDDIATKFEKAMTPEERAKLYDAIDYQENQAPTTYPKEFVENKVQLTLETLNLVVEDDISLKERQEVMILSWKAVTAKLEQRPSAQAILFDAEMKEFGADGIRKKDGSRPVIISRLPVNPGEEKLPQLVFRFETNPLDRSFDQFVKFHALPLGIVYDAASVNKLAEVFRPPESVRLKHLAAAAFAKYEDIKERSVAGLQYALEQRSVLKLDIKILPTIIQIPDRGVMEPKKSNVLILDLGELRITTLEVSKVTTDEAFYKKSEQEKTALLRQSAYDKFKIELKMLQMLFARPDDDWHKARKSATSLQHFLQPTGWSILLEKAAINDLHMPQVRITGQLPNLHFTASDTRLLDIVRLLLSIPTPPPAPEPADAGLEDEAEIEEPTTRNRAKMKAILEATGDELAEEAEESGDEEKAADDHAERVRKEKRRAKDTNTEQVQLELNLVLEKILVEIARCKGDDNEPYLDLEVKTMGASLKMRPLDMDVKMSLGSVEVKHQQYSTPGKSGGLYLIENPKKSAQGAPLLKLEYVQADKKSTFFASKFNRVEQLINIEGQPINVNLHQEALVDVQNFMQTLQRKLEELKKAAQPPAAEPEKPKQLERTSSRVSTSTVKSNKTANMIKKQKRPMEQDDAIINMKLKVFFHGMSVTISSSRGVITDVSAKGLLANLSIRPKVMDCTVQLKAIDITDPSPASTYHKILSFAGDNVFLMTYQQFNRTDEEKTKMNINDVDMEVGLSVSEMRFVFLNLWLSGLMTWLAPFQEAATAAAEQAGAAMQERARDAAAAIQELQITTRMRLKVDIHAPVIVVPQSSKSDEALVADFGQLKISNKFTSTALRGSKSTAIFDYLTIQLKDMKLSRVMMNTDRWDIAAECQMLEPVSFVLDVARNLSFSFYKEKPEMSIRGKLPLLKVTLSREDYGVIMKTLSGNLAEGVPPQKNPPATGVTPKKPDEKEKAETAKAETRVESTIDDIRPANVIGDGVKMDFSFEIESIEAHLYDGSSNLLKGVAQRDPMLGLAGVEIHTIKATGRMLEDGSMEATVFLFKFTMDDKRKDRSGITRLMDKKGGNLAQRQNMIDVVYSRDANYNQKAEVMLRPFFFFLCPEFLGALSRFVTVSKTDEELAVEEHARQIQNAQFEERKQAAPKTTAAATEQPPQTGTMDVRVFIEDPEVVLVEDAAEPESTQAIILKFQAQFHMASSAKTMDIDGGVTGLEITSCYFALDKRETNALKVLSPCDLYLVANMPTGAGQKIKLEFTPLKVRISPSVIRLLSAVSANMSVAPEPSAREKQAVMIARQQVWDQKAVADCDFWFMSEVLKAEEAVEKMFTPPEDLVWDERMEDECRIDMDKIEMTLEADTGAGAVPMIHLTAAFHALVQEWTKQMTAEASLQMELWYYNERFNIWEPLVEPILDEDGSRRPWQLECYVAQHNEYDTMDTDVIIQPPKMSIGIIATDNLQLTVTKTLLDLTTDLSEAFTKAAKLIEPDEVEQKELLPTTPWAIKNVTGENIEVMDSEAFSPHDDWRGAFPDFCMVELVCSVQRQTGSENDKPLLLTLRFPRLETIRQVDVARVERRIFGLPVTTHPGDQWNVVVDTTSHSGNKLVNIRSMIKIINQLPLGMQILCRRDGNLEYVGDVDSDGRSMSPRLSCVYTATGEFFVQPHGDKYDVGRQPLNWREFKLKPDYNVLIECPSVDGDPKKAYFIQASVELDYAYFENTHRRNQNNPCYIVYLSAPTLLRNALPYMLEITAEGVPLQTLNGGDSASLVSVVPGKLITLKVLADIEWVCQLQIEHNFEELTQHTFHGRKPDNTKMEIDLGLRTSRRWGTQEMTLYCPFWMINKTGLQISYKVDGKLRPIKRKRSKTPCKFGRGGSKSPTPGRGKSKSPTAGGRSQSKSENFVTIFEHEPGSDDPLLFTFSGDKFFAKNKKACLKVGSSEWSDKFPLDVVGSAGRVTCKAGNRAYEVSVNVQLGNSGLTKIVTFTPFYLVDNRTNADVEVCQAGIEAAPWTRIPSKECQGFWPEKKSERMQMQCRYLDVVDPNRADSQPFAFTESFESLVTMPNEFVGVYVSSHVSDNAVVVALEQYEDGMAPVLLINDLEDIQIYYRQKDVDKVAGLPQGKCVLFSWTNVLGKRSLLWSCGDVKNREDALIKDEMGEINAKKDVKVYWVSFMSGRQRILLFTQDLALATTASKPYELERIDTTYTLSLQAVNISLINNLIGMEICSLAIASSGIIWEFKKRRFKSFSIKDNKRLEDAFVKYNNDKNDGKKPKSRVMIGSKLEVDFEEMKQFKPKETEVRRSFQSGLWIQYMVSQHEQQVHMKVNHFQIDNQLPVCVFSTVLAPVPPPKSVISDSIPKPFAEVSFIMRKAEHSNIAQIKYFMVLIQEMAIQADKGFINAMIEMFTNEQTVVYGPEQFAKDLDIARQSLMDLAAITSSTEQKAYYEYLHFSPLKIHLSFSQGGVTDDGGKSVPIHSEFLNLLLKSIGVTLTEIQDVQFQLAYLERKAVFMNRQQLTNEAISHYTKQAIKQLYVLVLGLDIMGNPFGLIRDLSTGVETFFYEPIQGAIQGPEEFAEGLALGIRGLFGGAVGGAAGAVSRITGTLGKGVAALTLDDEYQKKRQQALARRPANVQEGLAQGAKGLAMGFVEGVTGVISKPIQGAKKGGFGGFAKGVGQGVVGLVARPVSGVVDFASSSLQAVKRITDTSEEVKKLRPARFIAPDKIIRPFSLRNAEGNQLLQEAAKGKYAADVYIAHAPVTTDKQFYCIITDHRILMVSKTLGALEVDWQYTWIELAEAPRMVERGLKVKTKQPKKKILGFIGSDTHGKIVTFADRKLGDMIAERAREAFERDHEPWDDDEARRQRTKAAESKNSIAQYRRPMIYAITTVAGLAAFAFVYFRFIRRK